MGKTIRNAPCFSVLRNTEYPSVFEELEKNVVKIDKKHQKVKLRDGAYHKGVSSGKFLDDEFFERRTKKFYKRQKAKQERQWETEE